MEFLNNTDFWIGLMKIIWINIILSGDNAVVIALAARSLPQAQRELEEVRTFAREHHGADHLEPWDIGYYSEKLRVHRYQISQEELRKIAENYAKIAGFSRDAVTAKP